MLRVWTAAVLAAAIAPPVAAQSVAPEWARLRALFKEMVETDTSLSSGSCTALAGKIADHLQEAGYPEPDIHQFTAPDHPKEGGIVAVLPGTDPQLKAILLLGHLDVVEARRADWTRDPYQFIEEDGYFYGRGTADMKSQVAIWVDIMMRLKEEKFAGRRTLKMALTCGEETSTASNGAKWLATQERELIDAEFAVNEGGGGDNDEHGKPILMEVQSAEKFPQNYTLRITNPGGHSSRPMKKNAIYQLAAALTKIGEYQFPFESNEITRTYFAKMAPQQRGEIGKAMAAFASNPKDLKAAARIAEDPDFNGVVHTTCVATLLSAGHANNALPQRAEANVNCRIFPGTTPEQVRDMLVNQIGDPEVEVTLNDHRSEVPKGPQPLNPAVFGPVEKLVATYWPGIPMVATMSAGATDGAFLTPVGIPTYGVSGIFFDTDGNGAHGLNERVRVDGVYKGRDFLYDLVKAYATAK